MLLGIFAITVSLIAQPALAGCAPCEAAKQKAQEGSVTAMAMATTLADNIENGTALNQSIQAISTISQRLNISGQADRIANATGIRINEINASQVREASRIIGSRIVEGIKENLVPVIEMVRNRTVYNLNNTPLIHIAKNLRVNVRPVEMENEHITINGTSLIVHNVTNPAVQVGIIIIKDGETIERNVTITRTSDKSHLNISVHGANAVTQSEIIYDNGTIYISRLDKTIELKTLPDQIRERVREMWQNRAEISEMRLELVQDRLKYVVRTRTKKNILGFIPADIEEESDIDADSGAVEATRGPWWSFMAW